MPNTAEVMGKLKPMKSLTGKMSTPKTRDKYEKRNAMIALAVSRGAKMSELAKLLGMSRERIRQIVKKIDPRLASWKAR